MQLRQALGIGPGTVAAFVGGGGKTSLILALVRELTAAGLRVVYTTTAKILPPVMETVLVDQLFALPRVEALLQAGKPCCVAGRYLPAEQKLAGVDDETVANLAELADVVLVEADGSRRLPVKFPAEHEPVIPPAASLVVPVAGADCLGQPLGPAAVHRHEAAAAFLGCPPGTELTPERVARLLWDPAAATRGRPPCTRVVPVINKVDLPGVAEAAPATARALLALGAPRVVLAAAADAADPVRAVLGPVAGLVLAAGSSRRFQHGHKLLYRLAGRTLLERSLDAPLGAGLREVVVVTGAERERMEAVLERYPVRLVHNPDFARGMSTSLRAGLAALCPDEPAPGHEPPAAVIIFLADQPNLTAAVVDRMIAAWRESGAPLVAPAYREKRGNPVLFAGALVPELRAARGDEGGRQVVQSHLRELQLVPCTDPSLFRDIDTAHDLPRMVEPG